MSLTGVVLAPAVVHAQESSVRIKGTIAALDGSMLTLTTGTGTARIALDEKLRVIIEEPAALATIGPGEGFRPWTGAPNGTMTNATVREVAATERCLRPGSRSARMDTRRRSNGRPRRRNAR